MKLIYIEWEDSASIGNGWVKKEEVEKDTPRLVRQVGWIIKEEKKFITLAATIDLTKPDSEFVSDGCVVIKSLIRKRIDLTKHI